MVFSDPGFLFFFLPIALAAGIGLSRVAFAPALLFVSLIFYRSAGHTSVLLMSIAINYLGGLVLNRRRQWWILAAFIAADLSILCYYKYVFFFAGNIDAVVGTDIAAVVGRTALPIGISFFTFQGISYLVDVYRHDATTEPNPITFGAYIAFFPQLIAGPIVRYRDVAADFHNPRIKLDLFAAGVARFAHGLLKKVLIADGVANIVDVAFAVPPDQMTFADAWLGALAFAVQIYFDFSGYSDMAIGLGQMFGIRIPENFNRPYSSSSMTEFWRRWHISLSTWFRDYVYIPLGGSRAGAIATYRNLLLVFLLVGLWHGAARTFVVWGAYNGVFLIFERFAFRRRWEAPANNGGGSILSLVARFCYVIPVVLVGWVIFRAPSLHAAAHMFGAMVLPDANALTFSDSVVTALAPQVHLAALLAGALTFLLPAGFSFGRLLGRTDLPVWGELASLAYATAACIVAGILVFSEGYTPFLYFRF